MLWTGPVPDFFLYFNYLVPFYKSFGRVAKVRGSLAGVGGNKYLSSYSVSISFFCCIFIRVAENCEGLAKAWDVTGICPLLCQYSLFLLLHFHQHLAELPRCVGAWQGFGGNKQLMRTYWAPKR